jgi:transposase
MNEAITSFVGLDVHHDSIAVGSAPEGREEPRFLGTVVPQWAALSKTLSRLGPPKALKIVYEAGPCGYTLARQLQAHGYACEVIAPAKIARAPGDRIKTDRRDALLLARAARAGELVSVTIPDERDEALRDLSRSREDAVRARLKARQQLKALLLRQGRRYTGKSSWTQAHERYLAQVSFSQPAQDIAFAEYRGAARDAHERVERLTDSLRSQLEAWRMRPVVEALVSLRGIDLIAAMTLVAEIGDFTRFARPRELMGFLGLIPTEHTSGTHRRQHHQDRQQPCAPRSRRSGLELSLSRAHQPGARSAPAGSTQGGARDRLAGAAAPRATLPQTRGAPAAVQQNLHSDRARTLGFCLGYRMSGQTKHLRIRNTATVQPEMHSASQHSP